MKKPIFETALRCFIFSPKRIEPTTAWYVRLWRTNFNY